MKILITETPPTSKRKKTIYDRLAGEIKIDGITGIERDTAFDNTDTYNSGGIRLHYEKATERIEGIKEGILLEVGFDNVAPNEPVLISSWAYNKAKQTSTIDIIDNRGIDILCYHPGYTFVEKLQTIATKFRKEMDTNEVQTNYMRQYYDVYSLLDNKKVVDLIGTKEYTEHKEKRFPKADLAIPVKENEAFLLTNKEVREKLQKRYEGTKALYYKGQPSFDEIMKRIQDHIDKL